MCDLAIRGHFTYSYNSAVVFGGQQKLQGDTEDSDTTNHYIDGYLMGSSDTLSLNDIQQMME